jgi:predicted nucleotidyltransferase
MIRYLAQQSLGSMRLLPEGSQRHDSGTIESEGIRITNKIKNKLSPKLARVAEEVTRRILETVQPQRVLLFGSSVRGDFTKDSDLDVLVIMRGPVHRRQLAQKINRNLHGVGAPVYCRCHGRGYRSIRGQTRHHPAPRSVGRPGVVCRCLIPPIHARGCSALTATCASLKKDRAGILLENLCFNAQQAAEKALKAVCLYKKQDSHSITHLVDILETTGVEVPEQIKFADVLTQYAVQTRYPGPIEEITFEEYQESLAIAARVVF